MRKCSVRQAPEFERPNQVTIGSGRGGRFGCYTSMQAADRRDLSLEPLFCPILAEPCTSAWLTPGGRPSGPEPHLAESENLRTSHGEKRSGIKSLQKLFSARIRRI